MLKSNYNNAGIKNMFDEDAFSNHSKLEVLEKIASFITGIKVAILVYMLIFFFFYIYIHTATR